MVKTALICQTATTIVQQTLPLAMQPIWTMFRPFFSTSKHSEGQDDLAASPLSGKHLQLEI